MKLAVLKPIMWNDKGYRRPAGYPSTSGYSHDYGYGHEEWNGNPTWLWHGCKVFHTEGTGKLLEAAHRVELGMVMIASHDATAYAVGVATSVSANTDAEMAAIADAVGVANEADYVWGLHTVQQAFASKRRFLAHWRRQCRWIRWRCPPDQYHWFTDPVALDPERITGKTRLSMHHGRFTQVTPEVLLDIVNSQLPKSKSAIRDWLCFGDFDLPDRDSTTAQVAGGRKRRRVRRTRNAPTDRRFQYWVEGNRSVEPHHHRLQARFVKHLESKGIAPREDESHIDVQYKRNGKTIFVEIKPTDNVEPRYAIRAAIGQLLEYRFKHDPDAALEMVIGKKPAAAEAAFVKSLGIRLTYYDRRRRTFHTA